MTTGVHLLPPAVETSVVTKDQFGTLPAFLLPLVSSLSHVMRIRIIPAKRADSKGVCHVLIEAGADMTAGNVMLQNMGRSPAGYIALTSEDLRPCDFIAWGEGHQRFRVVLASDHNNWVETTVAIK